MKDHNKDAEDASNTEHMDKPITLDELPGFRKALSQAVGDGHCTAHEAQEAFNKAQKEAYERAKADAQAAYDKATKREVGVAKVGFEPGQEGTPTKVDASDLKDESKMSLALLATGNHEPLTNAELAFVLENVKYCPTENVRESIFSRLEGKSLSIEAMEDMAMLQMIGNQAMLGRLAIRLIATIKARMDLQPPAGTNEENMYGAVPPDTLDALQDPRQPDASSYDEIDAAYEEMAMTLTAFAIQYPEVEGIVRYEYASYPWHDHRRIRYVKYACMVHNFMGKIFTIDPDAGSSIALKELAILHHAFLSNEEQRPFLSKPQEAFIDSFRGEAERLREEELSKYEPIRKVLVDPEDGRPINVISADDILRDRSAFPPEGGPYHMIVICSKERLEDASNTFPNANLYVTMDNLDQIGELLRSSYVKMSNKVIAYNDEGSHFVVKDRDRVIPKAPSEDKPIKKSDGVLEGSLGPKARRMGLDSQVAVLGYRLRKLNRKVNDANAWSLVDDIAKSKIYETIQHGMYDLEKEGLIHLLVCLPRSYKFLFCLTEAKTSDDRALGNSSLTVAFGSNVVHFKTDLMMPDLDKDSKIKHDRSIVSAESILASGQHEHFGPLKFVVLCYESDLRFAIDGLPDADLYVVINSMSQVQKLSTHPFAKTCQSIVLVADNGTCLVINDRPLFA